MNNKGLKFLIIAAIALALVMAGVILVKESGLDTSKIQEVYLEKVEADGNIERIPVDDADDVEFIKEFFSTETTSDGASLFTECSYRIILAQPDKEWHLYPVAGGDLSMIKVGDNGNDFVITEEGSEELRQLNEIFNKYIDTDDYEEECDWKEAILEDIK